MATYLDFFIYHFNVGMLYCISRYGGVVGDSSSMVADSGIDTWASTVTSGEEGEYRDTEDPMKNIGDEPAPKRLEMKTLGGVGDI